MKALRSRSTSLLFALLLLFTASAFSATPPEDATQQVTTLISRFVQAQKSYDPATLKSLMVDNYIEVSPLGEVDKHDDVIGFYDPTKKTASAEVAIQDHNVRQFGDSAVDIVTLKYTVVGPDKATHDLNFRATFVTVRQEGGWKIASAQYNAIRPH